METSSNERKEFFKRFFSLYIVLVLQNVVTLSVNLTDNIMLGSFSETALSGVTAVNQVQFVYQMLLASLADGLVMFCSQYWGKRQTGPMKKISAIAMRSAIVIAAILFLAATIMPAQILRLFTTDEAIIAEGVSYLNIVRFTYLFFAITQILLAILRSIEIVKIAFRLSIMTFFVNCGINYCLIFGHFGMPRMGAAGAAVGTLCARILEVIVLIIYIKKKDTVLHLKPTDFLIFDKDLRKDYFKVTAPVLAVNGLWGLNTALQTIILGHMTSAAIAANSAASNLYLLVKSTGVGSAAAASVIIGQTVGTGDYDLVKFYAKRMQKMFVVFGLISGTALFFLRVPVLSLYSLAPATKEMADTFLKILCIACVGMNYQMPTNSGIVKGGGDAMYVVKMDIISIWMIVLPLSAIMAFVVKASPAVVVCCLNADQVFKCIPAFFKCNYGHWIKKLTRDNA